MFLAMMLYLGLVLIRPQDYPALADSIGVPLQPMALLLAAGLWMFAPRKDFGAPQFALLLAFFGVMMISHVFQGWWGGALEQLQKFAPVVLAFVVFAHALDSRERIRAAMAAFVLCASVLAVHGIEQQQIGVGWTGVGLSQGTRIQYVGIFNDPNDLGMLFVACIPMALWLGSRGGLMGLRKLWWWSLAATLVYGVYLTDSRGSLLGLLAMLGVYVWQTRGVFMAAVGGVFAFAAMLALPSRLQELDASEASAHGRIESWYEGLMMFRGDVLFGIGPDNYSDLYRLTAHNSFVLILAETGIIGFTLWLAFVLYGFRMMWAGSRALSEPEYEDDAGWDRDGDAAAGERLHEPDAYARADAQSDTRARMRADAADAHHHPPASPHATSPLRADGEPIGIAGGECGLDFDREDDIEGDAMADDEGRAISLALLLSLVGFFVCAFFLSRSYVVVLYLFAALVVAHYLELRRRDPSLPDFALGRDVLLWPVVSVAAVVGLYMLVKVLLVIQ